MQAFFFYKKKNERETKKKKEKEERAFFLLTKQTGPKKKTRKKVRSRRVAEALDRVTNAEEKTTAVWLAHHAPHRPPKWTPKDRSRR